MDDDDDDEGGGEDEDDATTTEKMREAPRPELTLAQRYNLVPRPPELLTEQQWAEAHAASKQRAENHTECSICRDEFKADDQVLLSCSHVFHARCIRSFEKFAHEKCCPICRSAAYQKRRIRDGRVAFRKKAATRIQAWYRGARCRRWYRRVLASIPPSDPFSRRLWFADKLRQRLQADLDEMDKERADIERLFAEMAARKGETYDAPEYPDDGDDDTVMQEGEDGEGWVAAAAMEQAALEAKEAAAGDGGVDWDRVVEDTLARAEPDCPICFAPLQRYGGRSDGGGGDGGMGLAWLDCSHCFHWECLSAFESYNAATGRQRSCPMCRCNYKRRRM